MLSKKSHYTYYYRDLLQEFCFEKHFTLKFKNLSFNLFRPKNGHLKAKIDFFSPHVYDDQLLEQTLENNNKKQPKQ